MRTQVLCQGVDPSGEDGDLYFRGSRIRLAVPETLDNFLLVLFVIVIGYSETAGVVGAESNRGDHVFCPRLFLLSSFTTG